MAHVVARIGSQLSVAYFEMFNPSGRIFIHMKSSIGLVDDAICKQDVIIDGTTQTFTPLSNVLLFKTPNHYIKFFGFCKY